MVVVNVEVVVLVVLVVVVVVVLLKVVVVKKERGKVKIRREIRSCGLEDDIIREVSESETLKLLDVEKKVLKIVKVSVERDAVESDSKDKRLVISGKDEIIVKTWRSSVRRDRRPEVNRRSENPDETA